jgi:hypothetical protein
LILLKKGKMDSRFRGNDDKLLGHDIRDVMRVVHAILRFQSVATERSLNVRLHALAFQKPFGMRGAPSSRANASTPTRQLNKEIIMKRTLFAIAISLATMGYACAEVVYEDQVLAPVVVEHVDVNRLVQNCTPPQSAPECASFHELIRQSFTDREIGMLFGAATAYPEYRTSYNSVRERYESLLRYVEDHGLPAVAMVDEPVPVVVATQTPAVYEDTRTVTYSTPSGQSTVIRSDDPDAEVLNGQPAVDDDEYVDDEVVYYDDDDSLPPPRQQQQ